jgi:type II secretory pathway pseudopilin PulG
MKSPLAAQSTSHLVPGNGSRNSRTARIGFGRCKSVTNSLGHSVGQRRSTNSRFVFVESVINRSNQSAFTLVEIAISLGVIAFALIAIIGILPYGMRVQKENREETIVNQDARMLLDAIRSGARGLDDLTNYVVAITNYYVDYNETFRAGAPPREYGYTRTNSDVTPPLLLNSGARIVGLLSTPKYINLLRARGPNLSYFRSNYVVAYVRSLSGTANEKMPQNNPTVQELGFNYRLTVEVVPYANYDPLSVVTNNAVNLQDYFDHYNNALIARSMQNNVHDVRLIFRWPLLPNGKIGGGFQSFRTMVGGILLHGEEPGFPNSGVPLSPGPWTLYYFQPHTFATLP